MAGLVQPEYFYLHSGYASAKSGANMASIASTDSSASRQACATTNVSSLPARLSIPMWRGAEECTMAAGVLDTTIGENRVKVKPNDTRTLSEMETPHI